MTNYKFQMLNKTAGFTLIEALLSIALIAIITGLAAPLGQRFYNQNNLATATHSLTQTIRKAQTLAAGSMQDSNWGIIIASPDVLLFKGVDYANRDQKSDESYKLPRTVSVSGLQEIVFSKMNGTPNVTGNIIIKSNDGEEKTISINSKGFLSY